MSSSLKPCSYLFKHSSVRDLACHASRSQFFLTPHPCDIHIYICVCVWVCFHFQTCSIQHQPVLTQETSVVEIHYFLGLLLSQKTSVEFPWNSHIKNEMKSYRMVHSLPWKMELENRPWLLNHLGIERVIALVCWTEIQNHQMQSKADDWALDSLSQPVPVTENISIGVSYSWNSETEPRLELNL